jgi:hypothetical protein
VSPVHLTDIAEGSFYTMFYCAFILTATLPSCVRSGISACGIILVLKVSGFGAFQILDVGVQVAQPVVCRLLGLASFI